MDKYIGCKMIEAERACKVNSTGKLYDGHSMLAEDDYLIDGYKVRYEDGYESWSPLPAFEKAYMRVANNPELRSDAPSISQSMVDDFIVEHETITMGEKTTVVRAILRNGFELVESSSCVRAENYDKALGEKICMEKITDKVWMLLGFLLQSAVGGIGKENFVSEAYTRLTPMDDFEPVPVRQKAMLSQPMAGQTEDEITATRDRAVAALEARGYEVVNTRFTDEWYSKESMDERGVVQIPLCFLAKSLESMSKCHAAYFCKGWEKARGCRIEHEAAKAYGVDIIYEVEPGQDENCEEAAR